MQIEKLNLHPDDCFYHYEEHPTGRRTYTSDEAEARERLMEEAFVMCRAGGADIYEICIQIWREVTGTQHPDQDG